MEDNSDTSLPTFKLVVARATTSTMGSGNDQPKNLITPRAALTTSSATTRKAARALVTFTSVFVTFETETITFHPDGSVAPSSSPVPTTLVTTITITNTAASPTPEETTGSAASNGGTQGPKSGVIAGALGGTIFGLLLIGVLVICLFRRRRLERQAQFYSAPRTFPAHRRTNFVRGSDGRVYRLENIPLASLGKSKQTRGEQDETAGGGGEERAPGQMVIEVVPAAEGDRGPRLRTVRVAPASASAPAPHQGRVLVPAPISPLSSPVPASYPLLAPPAPARALRTVSSSVYSKPSQEDVASKFSEESYKVVNNGNSSGNAVWPAPLFASPAPGQTQAAPAAVGAAADEPGPSSSTTTPHPESPARGGPTTYVEPPSQSRWSPSTPTSDGSDEGLTGRLGQQLTQVGEKLADKWKETKEKGWKGLLLGGGAAGSKEEKKPSKEEKGKGKARDREIVVDPVNRGAPGWI